MHTIYIIINKINGKMYVGKTSTSVEVRWQKHIRLATGTDKPIYFYKAIRKYGADSFSILRLLEVQTNDEANTEERCFIRLYETYNPDIGYNSTMGGDGGGVTSLDGHRRISEAMRKRMLDRNPMSNESSRQKLKGRAVKTLELLIEEIIKLYTKDEKSLSEIGRIFNVSTNAIRDRLVKNSIKIRKADFSGKNNPMYGKVKELAPGWGRKNTLEKTREIVASGVFRKRKDVDILNIIKLYDEGKNYQEIGRMYGMSGNSVSSRLKRYFGKGTTKWDWRKNLKVIQSV
jgi:group I intron endonuclease